MYVYICIYIYVSCFDCLLKLARGSANIDGAFEPTPPGTPRGRTGANAKLIEFRSDQYKKSNNNSMSLPPPLNEQNHYCAKI